jgi:putative membrane protein
MNACTVLGEWDHGRMMHDGSGSGWWWLMGLVVVLIVVAVVLVVWLVTRPSHAAGSGPSADPNAGARRILAERLARGEIDPDEYQERLSHLT